jgi:hypothetical protein
VPVQAKTNVKYSNGMSYNSNGHVVWGDKFVDPAGAVLWVNTHSTKGVVVRALCLNVAYAPVKTHEQPTHPQPPTVTHHPPKCQSDCNQPPTCKEKPNQPKCQETPPCEAHPNSPECNQPPTCKEKPNQPKCQETPPKCTDSESHDDGVCGTPDSGAEQQPVQDNDPKQTAPTPGYHEGDAEQNAEEQGPPCSGNSCGLDQTQSGTEVSDSKDGGKAPGGGTTTPDDQPDQSSQPADSGQDNPEYDGSSHSTNPDEGTSDPVDTPASNHDDGGSGSSDSGHSDTGSSGDPLGDVSLPGTSG